MTMDIYNYLLRPYFVNCHRHDQSQVRGGCSSASTGGGTQGGGGYEWEGAGWMVELKLNRKQIGFQRGGCDPLTPSRSATAGVY